MLDLGPADREGLTPDLTASGTARPGRVISGCLHIQTSLLSEAKEPESVQQELRLEVPAP